MWYIGGKKITVRLGSISVDFTEYLGVTFT